MEFASIDKITIGKKNEKEDRRAKWVVKLGFVIERTIQKIDEKHART